MTDKRYEILSSLATTCGHVTLKGNEFFELAPVVRCKDCTYNHGGWCNQLSDLENIKVCDDWYCADGEREEE